MDKQPVNSNDLLTARPTFAAAWDKRGFWRCHQCGEMLAFFVKEEKEVRTNSYFEQKGIWIHPEEGFSHLPNSRERRRQKRERTEAMKKEGRSADDIQSEMRGMDWVFESATWPRQGWKQKADGTLESAGTSSMAQKTPRTMEVVELPAIFLCKQCNSKSKILGVGI